MADLLLGIDIGTSACKAAVFTLDGQVAAQCSEEYEVFYPSRDGRSKTRMTGGKQCVLPFSGLGSKEFLWRKSAQ